MDVRCARQADVDRLATIWFEGWREAHAELLPAELARDRSRERLRARMVDALDTVRVVEHSDVPVGFSMTRDDQLYQLYVSPEGRGTGAAATLVADAESRIAADGFAVAWLACAIGNTRAARFYEKCGWRLIGVVIEPLTLASGPMALEVWRYEKALRRD